MSCDARTSSANYTIHVESPHVYEPMQITLPDGRTFDSNQEICSHCGDVRYSSVRARVVTPDEQ